MLAEFPTSGCHNTIQKYGTTTRPNRQHQQRIRNLYLEDEEAQGTPRVLDEPQHGARAGAQRPALAVDHARSNDLKAVSTAWRNRVETESFQAASEVEKQRILEDVEREVMERRRAQGIDMDSKVAALNRSLGLGEGVGANVLSSGSGGGGWGANGYGYGSGSGSGPGSVPTMARPGYVAFPTAPIANFTKTPQVASPVLEEESRSSPATLRAGDDFPRLQQSSSPGLSAITQPNHEFSAAIEGL
ncbi:hypothetical protein F5B17DRAFT_392302 [Nemania serpens]|nr:hypothetical protein F5B17DRAFT_392302 [Nemania serpens]